MLDNDTKVNMLIDLLIDANVGALKNLSTIEFLLNKSDKNEYIGISCNSGVVEPKYKHIYVALRDFVFYFSKNSINVGTSKKNQENDFIFSHDISEEDYFQVSLTVPLLYSTIKRIHDFCNYYDINNNWIAIDRY